MSNIFEQHPTATVDFAMNRLDRILQDYGVRPTLFETLSAATSGLGLNADEIDLVTERAQSQRNQRIRKLNRTVLTFFGTEQALETDEQKADAMLQDFIKEGEQ